MLQGNKIVRFLSLLFLCLIVSLIGCGKEASAATSLMRNKTDDAIGKIEEFITSNPEHYEAYYSLGTLYEEKGMLDEALKAFNETSRLKPSSVDSLIRQGRIFNKIGQYDEAITVFEKAFGINRNRMEIYYYLGIAYKKAGKPDNTMLLWQGAIRKIDDTSNIYYLKGLVAKEKGDFESAEDLLKKRLNLNLTSPLHIGYLSPCIVLWVIMGMHIGTLKFIEKFGIHFSSPYLSRSATYKRKADSECSEGADTSG